LGDGASLSLRGGVFGSGVGAFPSFCATWLSGGFGTAAFELPDSAQTTTPTRLRTTTASAAPPPIHTGIGRPPGFALADAFLRADGKDTLGAGASKSNGLSTTGATTGTAFAITASRGAAGR